MDDGKTRHLYGLATLAIGLVIGLLAVSGSLKDIRRGSEEVTVTGSARRAIRSDFTVWRLSVSVQSGSLSSASAELIRGTDRVRAFLKSEAVPDSEITIKPVEATGVPEVTPEGRETGRIIASRVAQTFEVRSSDIDRITNASQRIGDLIADGIPVAPQSPEYLYTKLADIRTTLLEEATKDARQRAEAIVRSTGAEIGAVREARMGVFQITPRFSTEVADYGINDVTSIDKDVTAVVRVTFTIR